MKEHQSPQQTKEVRPDKTRMSRIGRGLMRTGIAGAVLVGGGYALDLSYTLATEPDHPSVMKWYGDINCKDATFVAVHLSSTGKDITAYQAINNQQAIKKAGGAILITEYGTNGDVTEFRNHLDDMLSECKRPDRPYVPVMFNGVSLGGKYAQWIDNKGLKNGIATAIIMESTPTGPDTVRDIGAQALMHINNPSYPIPITKGIVFLNAFGTEFSRRGFSVFTHPYAMKDVISSTEETNAKTLTWQMIANAQPWPIALQPGDNDTPIENIYSDGDSVVDTALVRAQLKLFTRNEVTEHEISRENSWKNAPSHADGWRSDATNASEYRKTYEAIYKKYGDAIVKHAIDVANTPILRKTNGPI